MDEDDYRGQSNRKNNQQKESKPEPLIKLACGFKCYRREIEMHWKICFEAKGLCFFPKLISKDLSAL